MAERSSIEWTDSTFNPWIGCTRVSPACDHCYAAVSTPSRRFGVKWGAGKPRHRTSEANWMLPLRWNERAFAQCPSCGWRGEAQQCISVPHPDDQMPTRGCPACHAAGVRDARRRVFCASLADVFDNEVDPQWRADLFDLIARTPNLDWLLLTKRIGNVAAMVPSTWRPVYPRNVWLGATVCNQAEADRDIPKLLATPAALRFVSMEPLLGPVDIQWAFRGDVGIDWVIVGGESGAGARPMRPDWVRSLRDQCAAAGTPFLFKQWGEWAPALAVTCFYPLHGMPQFTPRAEGRDTHRFDSYGAGAVRVGKKAAGRLLDGRTYDEVPA